MPSLRFLEAKTKTMHTVVIGIFSIALYLIATALLAVRLRNRITTTASKWKGLAPAAIACILHGWVLVPHIFTSKGLNLGIFHSISLITWIISTILILLAARRPAENLGIIVFPGTALAVALEVSFNTTRITDIINTPLEIHILISVAAYSVLSIAAVQAVLLTVHDHYLRNKRPGGFIRALPPLQSMETLLFQMIALGFILQTISLVTGFTFLENMLAQHLVHKTVLSLIAWMVFAILLWGRWKFGWRGRTAIRWTLSGFAVLALGYLGSKMVLELIIGRS